MAQGWKWSICGYDVVDQTQESIVEICLGAGFSGIEGAPPLFASQSDSELAATGAVFRSEEPARR